MKQGMRKRARSAMAGTCFLLSFLVASSLLIGCGGSASLFYQHDNPQALQRDTIGADGSIRSSISDADLKANGIIKLVPVSPLASYVDASITIPAAARESVGEKFDSRTIRVPRGFSVDLFAWDLGDPHDVVVGPEETVYVTDSEGGRLLAISTDGAVTVLATGLSSPHGLAIDGNRLFYATETELYRFDISPASPVGGTSTLLADKLPKGGDFYKRGIAYRGSDDAVLVSIGVTDRIDIELDREHGTIFSVPADGGAKKRIFLSGLRNTMGLDVHPTTGDLWGVDQGLDDLSEGLAPDEVNILKSGGAYGNPYFYSQNHPNPKFETERTAGRPAKPDASLLDLEPYSGSTDAHFYSGSAFGVQEKGALIVTMNGYEVGAVRRPDDKKRGGTVVRIQTDADGSNAVQTDLFSGWLVDGSYWGRPLATTWTQDGRTFFVTDEKNGVIYRIGLGS